MVVDAGLSSSTGYDLGDAQRKRNLPPLRANSAGSSAPASFLRAYPVH